MSVSAFALTPSSALLPGALAPVTSSLPLSTSPLPSSFSSLLHSIEEKSLHARRSGALQTIPTRCQLIKDTNAPSDERGKPLLVRLSSASPPLQSLRQPTTFTAPQQFPVRIKTEGGVYNKPDVLSDNLGCLTSSCSVRLPAVRSLKQLLTLPPATESAIRSCRPMKRTCSSSGTLALGQRTRPDQSTSSCSISSTCCPTMHSSSPPIFRCDLLACLLFLG